MIYQIQDKYYINVAPHVFKEVNLCLKDDDLILVPTNNKIEVYKMHEVKEIYFQHEKESLKKKLFREKEEKEVEHTEYVTKKSRPRKRR